MSETKNVDTQVGRDDGNGVGSELERLMMAQPLSPMRVVRVKKWKPEEEKKKE